MTPNLIEFLTLDPASTGYRQHGVSRVYLSGPIHLQGSSELAGWKPTTGTVPGPVVGHRQVVFYGGGMGVSSAVEQLARTQKKQQDQTSAPLQTVEDPPRRRVAS